MTSRQQRQPRCPGLRRTLPLLGLLGLPGLLDLPVAHGAPRPPASRPSPPPAPPRPTALLQMRSVGRAVRVELQPPRGATSKPQRCRTPCRLRSAPGKRRVRLDGLDRSLDLRPGLNRFSIRPTRKGAQVAGIVLVGLSSALLSLAGTPYVQLDTDLRLGGGAAGLALLPLATRLLRRSSLRITREGAPRKPSHRSTNLWLTSRLLAARSGAESPRHDPWRLELGGSREVTSGLAVGLLARASGPLGLGYSYRVLATARSITRLGLVRLRFGPALGYGWQRSGARGDLPLEHGPALEVEAALDLRAWRYISPTVSLSYTFDYNNIDEEWRHGLLLGAGLTARL